MVEHSMVRHNVLDWVDRQTHVVVEASAWVVTAYMLNVLLSVPYEFIAVGLLALILTDQRIERLE